MSKFLIKIGHVILSIVNFFVVNWKLVTKKFPEKKKKKSSYYSQYSNTNKPKTQKSLKFGLGMFVFGFIAAFLFVVIPNRVISWVRELPNPDLLVTKDIPKPSKILDRDGKLLYEIYIDKRFEPVKLGVIPAHLINATVAVEDDQFLNHHGFDLAGMIRAARETLVEDNLQGGSTITQQLVKNVLLSSERTLSRKLKELVLSIAVEFKYSKYQIMELYLNNISYGGSAWGVQSAAQKFFGKNVWDLDLAESALLAGLPTAPTTYSPLTGGLSVAKERQKYVLERMYDLGYITRDEADSAYEQQLVFATQTEFIRAPHFVAFIRSELEKMYGRRFVEQGGLTVRTSLDLDLQDRVQEVVTTQVLESAWLNISNGASVVLDVENREILAYVGSYDYFREGWGAFDVASAYRQPGSSIKPLTYVLALENGYTAASTIEDKPITYQIAGQPPYTPKNYDGKYHGTVTLRQALANSYNIPAVKLAEKLGPDNIVSLGNAFGFDNWQVDGSYGLSITLGGKEVRLLDHTNFFASLANLGVYKKITPFTSIKDSNGFEIFDSNNKEDRVVSQESAYIIWDILSDARARTPAFGTRNSLSITGKKVAVKTGTTDNIRDNLTMGYTPSYAVGVWVGNNDNTPLNQRLASGLSGAAPIWNSVMTIVLEEAENEDMIRPEGIIRKYDENCGWGEVFNRSGRVPSRLCPEKESGEDKDDD